MRCALLSIRPTDLLQLESLDPDFLNDAAAGLACCVMLESGWDGRANYPPESGLPEVKEEQKARCESFAHEAILALHQAKAAGFARLAENWENPSFTALKVYLEFRQLCGKPATPE